MVRFLLYTALALNFSAFAVAAADRYGGWLIEKPRSSVRTFSFKQSVQLNHKVLTSELGFICDQRKSSKSGGVILIPFDGTFQNDRNVVPVLIQKNADQYAPSDLLQNWRNGIEYIFLEATDDVVRLATFMKQMKWTVQTLCTLFFQMILLMALKLQTTWPLTCRDFPMVSMLSKSHALRPNRFQ